MVSLGAWPKLIRFALPQGENKDDATMSDISLTETTAAAAPAPVRPPLPMEPPPLTATTAVVPPTEPAPPASRELTAEQRADLAQLSQKVSAVQSCPCFVGTSCTTSDL